MFNVVKSLMINLSLVYTLRVVFHFSLHAFYVFFVELLSFMLCLREIQSKYFDKGLRDYMSEDYEVVGLIMGLSC
jgi:hypothetical protein